MRYQRLLLAFCFIIILPMAVNAQSAMPQGFLWGTVLSAYSVEGGQNNDWTLWESSAAKTPCGAACNHWELYAEDHAWMKKLGQNSVLISLEWSRLQPVAHTLNPVAVKRYRAMFKSLRTYGIEPVVILWDRTLPQWCAAYGGLEMPAIILNFGDYAGRVGRAFGDLVDRWVPLRAPVHFASLAFKHGVNPPGKSDITAYSKGLISLIGMHTAAWRALKDNDTQSAAGRKPCLVGALNRYNLIRPARLANNLDVSLAEGAKKLSAYSFVEGVMRGSLLPVNPPPTTVGKPAKGKAARPGVVVDATGVGAVPKGAPQPTPPPPPNYDQRKADFLIVNYVGLKLLKFNVFSPLFTEKVIPPGSWVDQAGQLVYPAGLSFLMKELKRYPVPFYIMVSIADSAGSQRGQFLIDHVNAIRELLKQGIPVKGFFYDSLLSGFEYEKGYNLKQGLLNVNYQIQERKPAGGAAVFRGLALSNGANASPREMKRPRIKK